MCSRGAKGTSTRHRPPPTGHRPSHRSPKSSQELLPKYTEQERQLRERSDFFWIFCALILPTNSPKRPTPTTISPNPRATCSAHHAENIFRFFEKWGKTATKYPPICDIESLKVLLVFSVRADRAQILAAYSGVYFRRFVRRPPSNGFMGRRNRGISVKTTFSWKYPDFFGP